MKKWFKILSLKEFIILSIGNLTLRFLNRLNYFNKYLPLQHEMAKLIGEGYFVKTLEGAIYLKPKGKLSEIRCLIRPSTSDLMVFRQVMEQHEYMPLINLITEHQSGDEIEVIVDAGSNIGLTSLFFNAHYPKAKIISIEPEINNYNQQLKNVKLNALTGIVEVLLVALWKNNTDYLYVSDDFRDGSSWAKSVKPGNCNKSGVSALSLNDIINMSSPKNIIDILKIDVEGTEKELFNNEEFVYLLKNNVRYLAVEIHDELQCRSDILNKLSNSNFIYKNQGETTIAFNTSFN